MHADPHIHAARHEQAAHDATSSFDSALADVTAEIRAAFASYFAGKTGVYVPAVTWRNGVDVEYGKPARDAVESATDYVDTNEAFHALLRCSIAVDVYREALVLRYIDSNAADIATCRTGFTRNGCTLDATCPRPDLSFLSIMAKEPA